ncbi:MAG TPA: 3-hydroxyacyl-CoA dehydrogenase NAD-binding domain-containing protein [Vicinamibacterales bacterium]|nr:3-hydroxyacyl-CoA dehydrogenase NAD-binding domain-containing protein [Vicinamibacterales bacterium]
MSHQIRSAAVLGAGVMGAQIAAHVANAGIPVLLLDLTAEIAAQGLKRAKTLKPDPFFTKSTASLITIGGFDTDLKKLGNVDWICEAVVERLDIKRPLFEQIDAVRRVGSIVSSNSSGIPMAQIAEGRSADFRRHFLGTHFFNPPRYLHLVEIIPLADTDPAVVDRMKTFLDRQLGKGVVVAKDSPNFIANHIGLYGVSQVLKALDSGNYTIEEIDAITGPALGRPKSATFRTMDIAGIDILAHVAKNLNLDLPPLIAQMVERGWIGEKAGQGFYKKVGKDILTLDPKTLEYRPKQPAKIASLEAAKSIDDVRERTQMLLSAKDKAGEFLRATLTPTIDYAARVAPDIAYSREDVDKAMKWGFGWELGPFEIADRAASASVLRHKTIVKKNAGASLVDLGDGVLCVEFHSKMNAIGADTIAMLHAGVKEAAANFAALVVGNDAPNFSAGANLMLLLLEAQEGNWDEIDLAVRTFQNCTQALRFADVPVVVAPAGMTLGGGCEIAIHGDRIQAAAETYMGQVEVGVGLIPAGGGTKEMYARVVDDLPKNTGDLLPFAQRVFELLGFGTVSTSAAHARELGFLRDADQVTMNRDRLLDDAKAFALERVREGYRRPQPRTAIPVGGETLLAALKLGVHLALRAGRISEHDAVVGRALANIIAGGSLPHQTTVTEQYLLDLEREAFLKLCGERKTLERIQYTLKTGKPLRN